MKTSVKVTSHGGLYLGFQTSLRWISGTQVFAIRDESTVPHKALHTGLCHGRVPAAPDTQLQNTSTWTASFKRSWGRMTYGLRYGWQMRKGEPVADRWTGVASRGLDVAARGFYPIARRCFKGSGYPTVPRRMSRRLEWTTHEKQISVSHEKQCEESVTVSQWVNGKVAMVTKKGFT